MIKINQLKVPVTDKSPDDDAALKSAVRKALKLPSKYDFNYKIVKKSVDARKKDKLLYIYSVEVSLINCKETVVLKKLHDHNITTANDRVYEFPEPVLSKEHRICIVGSGPAGLFCALFLARQGYRPVIFERGMAVEERIQAVDEFWATGKLNINSNIQFGEGGAGTFSDGKLNTAVKEKNGRIRKVLETFCEYGAPYDIMYTNKPHIGTDILKIVVKNIREEIIKLGGEVHFNSCVTDIDIVNHKVAGITINNKDSYDCDILVLATGHSARDTFEMLKNKQDVIMEPKAFAVGLRVEHSQQMITEHAYGNTFFASLPVADYKVTAQTAGGRGVYSFCMCPGGYVVNASSEEGYTCVNGMSYSKRDGINANSAIIVTIDSKDYGEKDVLDGMYFQRKLEKAAYMQGMGAVPYQLNEDFQRGIKSTGYAGIVPQIKGLSIPANLREVLPDFLCDSIIDGMKSFDKIINGFNMPDAVFSGVESRTSSPVRILRGDTLQSAGVAGLYPCGEGAGYAGGITSAAVDGIKVAEAIASLT